LLGLLGDDSTTDTSASGVPSDTASGSGPVPAAARLPAYPRSISLAVNGSVGGGDAGGNIGVNRHRYGHRHTRSEAGYNMPVVVRSYRPAPSLPVEERIDEEDAVDLPLPTIEDFSFDGILKAVDPEVQKTLDAVTELCTKYQDSLRTEVDRLTNTQTELTARMKYTDQFAAQVLNTTRKRSEKLEAESSGLKGGAAVDSLAEAAEATHAVMTSVVSTLLAIDEMLPPQERLSPETSAHRKHYPHLHGLLMGKAAELSICFGSGKSNEGRRPSTNASPLEHESSDIASSKAKDLPLRRRLSSSSQILLSTGMASSRTPPPQLQLKTILPSAAISSAKVIDSQHGSYLPLAPQTATGISLTHSNGAASGSDIAPLPPRRSNSMWGRRPSTSGLALFSTPQDAGVGSSSSHNQPVTPSTGFSWIRNNSSETWSSIGIFGGSSRRNRRDSRNERAEDRLKRVLESAEPPGKGKKVVGTW